MLTCLYFLRNCTLFWLRKCTNMAALVIASLLLSTCIHLYIQSIIVMYRSFCYVSSIRQCVLLQFREKGKENYQNLRSCSTRYAKLPGISRKYLVQDTKLSTSVLMSSFCHVSSFRQCILFHFRENSKK